MIRPRAPMIAFRSPLLLPALCLLILASTLRDVQAMDLRLNFQRAEKALHDGRMAEFHHLKNSLGNYPLKPYLDYAELTLDLSRTDATQVKAFLAGQDETALGSRLRTAWLKHLGANERWSEFLEYYRPSSSNELRCLHLKALMAGGKKKEAMDQAKPLWLTSDALPETCVPLLEQLHKDGGISPTLVWERLDLIRGTRGKERLPLMRDLKRFLPAKEYAWHNLWMQSLGEPERVLSSPLMNQQHPSRDLLVVHSIIRLGWKNREGALAQWDRFKDLLAPAQKKRVEKGLGSVLAHRRHPQALAFLGKVKSCSQMPGLCELRVRHALRRLDWRLVSGWIDEMPKNMQLDEEWRYWKARALEQTGHKAEAGKLYQEVAQDRSYYGFLAADRIGKTYRLEHLEVAAPGTELRALASQPAFQRAQELYLLGRKSPAQTEWYWATRNLDQNGLKLAAKLAYQWGWSHRAIMTLLPTGYWDDLEIRFPVEFREQVEAEAKVLGISSAWIFAILRQESSFAADARSPVGALGLMQLMPHTAQIMAKKLDMGALKEADILAPKNNIRLGSRYLKQLHEEYNGEILLATPSYNAGPHRTRAWLPDTAMPADLWVEFIPFDETRLYVKRVMSYTAIYESRLDMKVIRLKDRMPDLSKAIIAGQRRDIVDDGSPPAEADEEASADVGLEKKGNNAVFDPLDL